MRVWWKPKQSSPIHPFLQHLTPLCLQQWDPSGSIGTRPLFRPMCSLEHAVLMAKPVEAICYPHPYSRASWSCTRHSCEQLKLLYVAVPLIPPPAPGLFICFLRCCLTPVFLQLQSPLSLVLSLLLSSSKWPCETRLGWAIPVPYSEASSGVDWIAGVVFFISALFPAGAGPVWLFSPRFLFSHSPLCELFNLSLQKVWEYDWRADECQGGLGSSKWQACRVLHRSPSGSTTETWHWYLRSNASAWVHWTSFPYPRAQSWVNPSFSKVMWQDA